MFLGGVDVSRGEPGWTDSTGGGGGEREEPDWTGSTGGGGGERGESGDESKGGRSVAPGEPSSITNLSPGCIV